MTKGKGEIRKKMALKVEKVLSCIIVFVILMSVVPGTVFAVDSGDNAAKASNYSNANLFGEEEIHEVWIQGTVTAVVSDVIGGGGWNPVITVKVEKTSDSTIDVGGTVEVVSTPPPSADYYNLPRGTCEKVDIGDKVKVFGESDSLGWIVLYGSSSYYLKKGVEEAKEVKFRGKILVDHPIISFYSFDIKIDKVLDDPTGNLQEGETVTVNGPRDGPAQVDDVTVGDNVEVFGAYRGDEGIFLSDYGESSSDHYVKKLEEEPTQFYIRPSCQDVNGNHLNAVNYEFVDYPTYKGTCDYNEYLKAPGQGTYWVKFTKGDLEATVTLESHTKTFTGTVVTLREKEKEPKLCTSPDPPSHNFGTVAEGQTKSWYFYITNCGDGTLTWSVSSDKSWITVDPLSGSTTTEIGVTVTIDTYGLSPGTHTGYVTVTSNEGSKTGTITVNVPQPSNQTPVNPTLTPDKSSPQPAGTNIKWTASATDPDGDQLYYQFAMTRPATGNSPQIVREWSTANTWTWSTSSADEGTNDIIVGIRDGHHASTDSYDCITRFEGYLIGYPLVVSAYDVDGTPASEIKGTTTVELIRKGETSPTMAKTINNENKAIFTNIPDGTYYIKIWHDTQIEQGSKEFWGPLSTCEFTASTGSIVGLGRWKETPYVEEFNAEKSTVDINTPVNLNVVVKVGTEANLKASVIIRDEDGHEVYRDTSSEKVVQKGDSTTFSFSFTPTKKGTYYGLAKAYLAGGGDVCTDNYGWVAVFEVAGGEEYNPKVSIPTWAPLIEYGHEGSKLTFIIKVENKGTKEDTIDLTAHAYPDNPAGLDISLSNDFVTLSHSESKFIYLNVLVKSESDNSITITATSEGDDSKVSSCEVYTGVPISLNPLYFSFSFSNTDTKDYTLNFNAPEYVKLSKKSLILKQEEIKEMVVVFDPDASQTDIREIYVEITDETSGETVKIQIKINPDYNIIATDFDIFRDGYNFPNYGKLILIPGTEVTIGGRCYPMSETSILYFTEEIQLPSGVVNVYKMPETIAKKTINAYHLAHLLDNFRSSVHQVLDPIDEKSEYKRLKNDLEEGNPAMIGMEKPGIIGHALHAVVAYKVIEVEDKSYILLYDNELPYSEANFMYSFPCAIFNTTSGEFNYGNTFTKFMVLKPNPYPKPDTTTLSFECPVNATITDQSGRIISDDGTNEIPDADMLIAEDTKIFYLPVDLTYSVGIDAYDSGTFNFTRVSPVGNDFSITKFENVPITSSTKASVDIVPDETDYTMSIDSEGDGEYESNILPDVSETIEVGPIVATIEVAPSSKTLYAGSTQQFTATAKDQYGDPMTGIAIEWTSSNTAVGTVSPMSATTGSDGTATTTFRAASAGTTTVKAAYGDVSGMATVTVQTKTEEPSTVKRGGGGGGGGGPSDTDGDGISDLSEKVDGTNRYDPCDPDPDCFACLAKLGLTPKPKPKERSAAMMPFGAAMPAATETTTETPAETVTPEPAEATPAPKQPGFEVIIAIVGLLAVAYVSVRRKRK